MWCKGQLFSASQRLWSLTSSAPCFFMRPRISSHNWVCPFFYRFVYLSLCASVRPIVRTSDASVPSSVRSSVKHAINAQEIAILRGSLAHRQNTNNIWKHSDSFTFLDAPSHLYKRACPSVCPWVRPLALRKNRRKRWLELLYWSPARRILLPARACLHNYSS